MKKLLTFLLSFVFCIVAYSQTADKLISEGIALHDKKDLEGAIAKYDAALKIEPTNCAAMYEKSLSLMEMKRYNDSEALLKKVLEDCKDAEYRRLSYVNYGTLLDYQKEPKKSIKVYEKGIKEFPDNYLLYFNKGITQLGIGDEEDAMESFKNAATRNPYHASSHNALARMVAGENRIPAILALVDFLLIESKGKRAEGNLELLNKLIMRGVQKTGEKSTTITLDAGMLDKKKKKDDDFSTAEFMLSLLAASNDVPDSLGAKTEGDRLSYKLQMLINIIDEEDKKDKGFFKNFYVPFFKEMKKNDLVTIASHIILSSSGDKAIDDWLKENKDDVEGFYRWFENYKWMAAK
jgi:tetratricopeptide (TPR) repeat protein